ncbi:UNVERIFIED_CONTAM: hypothetical protein Slati_1981300 [Sesamum latifolium]|uniref:Uncharacterized protein n=1 Tax=Sesamum latifolium TaxID=2727402 RepID=A0AAW2WRV4_9LAMI
MRVISPCLLFITCLVLSPSLSHSYSFSFSNYQTILSLSHSLISRVATRRASRGDLDGAERARALAYNLERGSGLGFYKFAWNVGWDYIKHYAWRDAFSFETLGGVLSDLNELLEAVCEFNRIQSEVERVAWVGQYYKKALRVSRSLFTRLLKVFRQPGPLREVMVTLQKEVVEGDLLRDCLELGGDDLKGLIQVFKDIALLYYSASPKTNL